MMHHPLTQSCIFQPPPRLHLRMGTQLLQPPTASPATCRVRPTSGQLSVTTEERSCALCTSALPASTSVECEGGVPNAAVVA